MGALSTSQGNVEVHRHFPAFDLPIEGRTEAQAFAIAFALRGIGYYEDAMRLAPRSPEAAVGLVRSLIDLTILARWIEGAPSRRLALYKAEDDLGRVKMSRDYDAIRATRGHPPATPFTPQEIWRFDRRAHWLRRLAVHYKERVSPKDSDPLVPSIRARAELGGDEREQYFMFGMLSKQVHLAGRSFVGDRLERRTDGHHLRPKAAVAADLIRGVAVPAIAMLLASASRQLDLGLEVALDDLRLRLARWDPPVAAVAE